MVLVSHHMEPEVLALAVRAAERAGCSRAELLRRLLADALVPVPSVGAQVTARAGRVEHGAAALRDLLATVTAEGWQETGRGAAGAVLFRRGAHWSLAWRLPAKGWAWATIPQEGA
jgi:hypothetical protein